MTQHNTESTGRRLVLNLFTLAAVAVGTLAVSTMLWLYFIFLTFNH